jgi:hypothetical protein
MRLTHISPIIEASFCGIFDQLVNFLGEAGQSAQGSSHTTRRLPHRGAPTAKISPKVGGNR